MTRGFWMSALVALLTLGGSALIAQDNNPPPAPPGGGGPGGGRGNFDPEQMRQRMMERYREQLDVKDDAEWKLISTRVEKVNETRREVGGGFGFGRGGRGGPGGPGGPGGGGRRGGDAGPEAEALQKAIDDKSSAEDLKEKLTAYREAKKKKEAALEKAQEDLRKVLTARQEAVAVLNGLLK